MLNSARLIASRRAMRTPTLAWLASAMIACGGGDSTSEPSVERLRGQTMGTSYSVIAVDPAGELSPAARLQGRIDSLLEAINAEVNTYDPSSMISRLNAGDTLALPVVSEIDALQAAEGGHLAVNLALAEPPYRLSGGAFDPTVGPLVEYYGFGAGFVDHSAVDPEEVQRLLGLVGFANFVADTLPDGEVLRLYSSVPGARLDLSALAKGYAVDQVGHLLAGEFGLANFFVEIGGETVVRGASPRGTPWTIGINTPVEGAALTDLEVILELTDAAVATSGNYRNVRIRGGERYVHTIDPRTGSAGESRLLSASVLAPSCAVADAYATACMASGEGAEAVLAAAGLPGCLIFAARGDAFDVRYVGDFAERVVAEEEQQ